MNTTQDDRAAVDRDIEATRAALAARLKPIRDKLSIAPQPEREFPPRSAEDIFEKVAVGRYEVFPAEIAPDDLTILLEINTANRSLTPGLVLQYRAMIRAGQWEDKNGQTISFNVLGQVDNGQHRMTAFAAEGVPMRTLVVVGNAAGAKATIDHGKKRTLADTLHMDGKSHVSALAVAVRTAWRHENGILAQRWAAMDTLDVLGLLGRYDGLEESVLAVASKSVIKRLGSTGVIGFLHWAFGRSDAGARDRFFDAVMSGAGLEVGNPILGLRNRLLDGKKYDHIDTLFYWIKAWNLFRRGKTVGSLIWKKGGDDPEPFPERIL